MVSTRTLVHRSPLLCHCTGPLRHVPGPRLCQQHPRQQHTPKQDNSLSERDIARLVKSILRFIAQCHAKGIVYRDVKLDNFLFLTSAPDSPLKATDFGLSIRHSSGERPLTSRSGTPAYMAPEVRGGGVGCRRKGARELCCAASEWRVHRARPRCAWSAAAPLRAHRAARARETSRTAALPRATPTLHDHPSAGDHAVIQLQGRLLERRHALLSAADREVPFLGQHPRVLPPRGAPLRRARQGCRGAAGHLCTCSQQALTRQARTAAQCARAAHTRSITATDARCGAQVWKSILTESGRLNLQTLKGQVRGAGGQRSGVRAVLAVARFRAVVHGPLTPLVPLTTFVLQSL